MHVRITQRLKRSASFLYPLWFPVMASWRPGDAIIIITTTIIITSTSITAETSKTRTLQKTRLIFVFRRSVMSDTLLIDKSGKITTRPRCMPTTRSLFLETTIMFIRTRTAVTDMDTTDTVMGTIAIMDTGTAMAPRSMRTTL
ncbi:hypothetical protein RSOL_296000 [Rhizoctonia solani AG-3 Rhs1AP]|uniref:Uncharacterized protein n=2 Tax=Rhizoctonia solani AG-3 TaxID=1086053 RepID=A0A074S1X0_9AGAM|nr:hypothetical protein RSOL_296000 [Rhizoctonia solani AG-3 Rhs1AP]KEP51565.1 hypothetical protein V565_059450 [Rhizoctonia solani 123E]